MSVEEENKRFQLVDEDGRVAIAFDEAILIGRSPAVTLDNQAVVMNLVVKDSEVSRIHARVSPAAEGAVVEDLGSTNGTFVNSQRIQPRLSVRIVNGDKVRFNVTEFSLVDAHAKDADTSAADGHDEGTRIHRREDIETTREPGDEGGRKGGTRAVEIDPRVSPDRIKRRQKVGTIQLSPEHGGGAPSGVVPENIDELECQYSTPTLVVLPTESDGVPRAIALQTSGDINFWNIGRDPQEHELHIVLAHPSVSAFHAKLLRRGDRWKIIDQLATNGVWIDGERFYVAFLSSKNVLRFGEVEVIFLLPPTHAGGRTRFRDWWTGFNWAQLLWLTGGLLLVAGGLFVWWVFGRP